MSLLPEKLILQRKTRARDDAGGKTETWGNVWTAQGTVNFFARVTWQRLEEGAHNSTGPGTQDKQLQLVTFERPWPKSLPRPNDRFLRADGTTAIVQNVRPYEETLQVDVEVFA